MKSIDQRDIVILADADGTLLDTMPAYVNHAVQTMTHHFPIAPEEAKAAFLSTVHLPFDEQLAILDEEGALGNHLEGGERTERLAECASEYQQLKRLFVYTMARAFPETGLALERLKSSGNRVIVSTIAEKGMVERALIRNGLMSLIDDIYCRRDGTKPYHIATVRSRYQPGAIIKVGDTPGDMALAQHGAIAIGRCGSIDGVMFTPKQLYRAGAHVVLPNLAALPDVVNEELRPRMEWNARRTYR